MNIFNALGSIAFAYNFTGGAHHSATADTALRLWLPMCSFASLLVEVHAIELALLC
jgi:hypothetical protein